MEDKKIKGYLFNLIIYTAEDKRAGYFHHIVHDFISTFPSRVIFIKGTPKQDKDFLETSCLDQHCDQITIEVAKNCIPIVPSIVLPHLVPDLPIYLIWGPNPTEESELLLMLKKLATRLIYDSMCDDNLQSFAKKILKTIETIKIEYMDVGWAQISGIRDVIAKTFNSKRKLKFLDNTKSVTIKYNNHPEEWVKHFAREAIYLQGWLASQLNWDYVNFDQKKKEIFYKTQANNLSVTLEPQDRPNLRPGRIFEIQFKTFDNLSIILSLAEKQSKFLYYFSSAQKCDLPLSLPISDIQKGINAMKEVFYFQSSDHYTNMLKKIAEVSWNI